MLWSVFWSQELHIACLRNRGRQKMYHFLWLCTYAENHTKLAFQNFQTLLHSIKHSPWPPSLTPLVQAMGVCQSTFRMWFIIADITIHLMATWSFHNDIAGSDLIMLRDRLGRRLCDQSCRLSIYPCSESVRCLGVRPPFSMHHHSETGSDVNTRFKGSSRMVCTEDPRITASGQYVSDVTKCFFQLQICNT